MKKQRRLQVGTCEYFLVLGDLTHFEGDAIVNAANSSLMGGGGVDGMIHKRGGPQILQECLNLREKYGLCDPGEAVITSGGKLPVKHVIHTVGPVWITGRKGEPAVLKSCYRECFQIIRDYEIKTVAFPSIATGAYRFPVDQAAKLAQEIVLEEIPKSNVQQVGFFLYDENTYLAYESALKVLRP